MGFDGLLFGRADHEDIKLRKATKNMEMVWNASTNLGRESWLFTGILPDGYSAPDDLCFDFDCDDEPIMVSVYYLHFLCRSSNLYCRTALH
jgi:Glycosyl hydrolases family 38 N-terminal domain